jgi:WhiB family redox-sensing transcriptional regulator
MRKNTSQELCFHHCYSPSSLVAFEHGWYATLASAPRFWRLEPIKETTVSILASSLALGSADYTWRTAATCRDTDPELFFPVGTTGQALLQIAKAKSVCCECPVNVECLEFALETNQDTGIWGGTSEEERRQMRREAAAAARAQRAAR